MATVAPNLDLPSQDVPHVDADPARIPAGALELRA
jgi:hypothetical protein